jgi:hypothetical protein
MLKQELEKNHAKEQMKFVDDINKTVEDLAIQNKKDIKEISEIKTKVEKFKKDFDNEEIAVGMYMEQYQFKRKNTYDKYMHYKQIADVLNLSAEMLKASKSDIMLEADDTVFKICYDDVIDCLLSYHKAMKTATEKQKNILDTPIPDHILDRYLKIKIDHKQI